MNEWWLPVRGFGDRYFISNLGRVKRAADGSLVSVWRLSGYPAVTLRFMKEAKNRMIHSLVMESFVGPRPDGLGVAHLDGNKDNHRLSNLSYVTQKENISHKKAHGTLVRGEKQHNSKLTEADVISIRSRVAAGEKIRAISREYGTTYFCIWAVVKRLSWGHI